MEFEKSCGAVIYKIGGQGPEYLIISHKSDGHWGFPKGHVENEETERETALREVLEETGIQVKLVDNFRSKVEYEPKVGVQKEVVFFLGKLEGGNVKIQFEELRDYKWCYFEEALETLSYESSKEVLKEARDFIIRNIMKSNMEE